MAGPEIPTRGDAGPPSCLVTATAGWAMDVPAREALVERVPDSGRLRTTP